MGQGIRRRLEFLQAHLALLHEPELQQDPADADVIPFEFGDL